MEKYLHKILIIVIIEYSGNYEQNSTIKSIGTIATNTNYFLFCFDCCFDFLLKYVELIDAYLRRGGRRRNWR